jgi:CheY-like chemotaxis protein
MKPEYLIICVEDEPDVLDAVLRDLSVFESHFILEGFSSADAVRDFLTASDAGTIRPALFVCDHMMPGTTGVDFLVEVERFGLAAGAKKMLLTGQAGLQDTVKAVNHGHLDFYLAKPWTKDALVEAAKGLLTGFVKDNGVNPLPYMNLLDAEVLSDMVRSDRRLTDR